MIDLVKELCGIDGVSGDEQDVAAAIISHIENYCDFRLTPLGDIIAIKRGRKRPRKKVLFDAHMDEVGFIVTHITEDGFLKFAAVGGIDSRTIQGKPVIVGKNRVYGILSSKPVHLIPRDMLDEPVKPGDLSIDIGCSCREDAQKLVYVGDRISFDSPFLTFGDGFIKAKALDDRAGCAVLIKMIQSDLLYDTFFSFSTREEVSSVGAKAVAYSVKPDIAVAVEATTAADIGGVPEEKRVCFLGKGPVVSFMDRGTVYDRKLYDLALDTANDLNMPAQPKLGVFGGNDAAAIHSFAGGARPVAISIPCRYLHTPSCVLKTQDVFATYDLLMKLSEVYPACD